MSLNISHIIERLPHRYPILLIDRVVTMVPGKSLVAIKNVTINEPYFQGHFPHYAVMPGALIIESMVQAAALLSFNEDGETSKAQDFSKIHYLIGIDKARFRRPVIPGDQLHIQVNVLRLGRLANRYHAQALVEGQIAADARLTCTVRDSEGQELR